MPAGMSCAKTTTVPQVRKNQTPRRPIPLMPPAYPMAREKAEIAIMRVKPRIIIILCIFADIFLSSIRPYFRADAASYPGTPFFPISSAALSFASPPLLKIIVVEVPIKEKKSTAAGMS
jgi:hypothetical protein